MTKRTLADFQDADGNWLDESEWPTIEAVATCRTAGCPVEGVDYEITVHENVDGVLRGVCGRCHQPTDIRKAGVPR